jgi:hypothetical protein
VVYTRVSGVGVGRKRLGVLKGGKLHNLTEVQFRGLWVYALAFLLQAAVRTGLAKGGLGSSLYAISFIVLGLGSVLDWHYSGIRLVSTGVLINGFVICANSGKMPVILPSPVNPVLKAHQSQLLTHQLNGRGVNMPFLSDVIPFWTPFQGAIVVSVGDIILSVGLIVFIYDVVKGRSRARTTHQ